MDTPLQRTDFRVPFVLAICQTMPRNKVVFPGWGAVYFCTQPVWLSAHSSFGTGPSAEYDDKSFPTEASIRSCRVHFYFLQAIDSEIKKELDAADKAARNDPEPPNEDMAMYIYSEGTNGQLVRGSDPFTMYETNEKLR